MEAIYKLDPSIHFDIFTRVPRRFFHDSLSGSFGYYSLLTDVGLVQKSPLKADLQKTLRRLNHFLPLDHSLIKELSDLVNASDAVIGKAGYSTIAEIYYAGLPFGYIARGRFRESKVLVSFIETQMNGLPIAENKFYDGTWLSYLPELLALSRIPPKGPNGASQVAHFIYNLIV
jgi:hypothetical protein